MPGIDQKGGVGWLAAHGAGGIDLVVTLGKRLGSGPVTGPAVGVGGDEQRGRMLGAYAWGGGVEEFDRRGEESGGTELPGGEVE